MVRLRLRVAALGFLVCGLLLVGCASAPPPKEPAPLPQLAVRVFSEPPGATIVTGRAAPQPAPVAFNLSNLDEILAIKAENPSGLPLVERRIRVKGERDFEVHFRFASEPTALAKTLGLSRITVFDYAGGALFDVNQAVLRPEARPLIDRQAQLLQGPFSGIRVFACGHTDSSGGEEHNLALSLARAQAVSDALVAGGVDRARIAVQGFGWQFPVADNTSEEGRVLNRRAEIVLPDS